MKNKKVLNTKITTETGVGLVLLIAILIGGVFYLQGKKEQHAVNNTNTEQSQSKNQQILATQQNNLQTNVYTDATYGFEIIYPSGWSITKPSSPQDKQNLEFVFSTNGQMSDGTKGTLLFGKYDTYNNSLTKSVDGNVNILNSKVNIIGPKSSYKEVRIEGGRAFINKKQSTIASNDREIFIVGKNVIFNGNVSINYKDIMDEKKIDEFANILLNFKFLQ